MKRISRLLWVYVSSFKSRLLLTFLISFFSSITTILIPLSIGKYYALVFDFKGSKSFLLDFLPAYLFESVPQFLFFFAAILGLRLGLGFLQRYFIASTGERMVNQMRLDLFAHQLSLDMKVYDEKGIGKYLLRYSGDLKSIQNYLTRGLIGFVVDLCLLVIAIFSIGIIHQTLAWVCLLSIPFIVLPIYLLNEQLNQVSEVRRNRRSNMLSFVNQRLIGISSVKAFNRHKPEFQKFEKRSNRLLSESLKYHQLSSLIYVLIPVLLYGMLAVVMYVIYNMKRTGIAVSQGGMLSAFLLIMTMLPVFRRLLKVTVVWKLGKISLRKLIAVFELPNNYVMTKDDLVLDQARIELNQLLFNYGETVVLNKISHTWKNNGVHLIHGKMGSGKSSLIKLLLGIHYPTSGKIVFDKQDISTVNEKSLRGHLTVVSSDFPLLGKTVFEAISYSRKQRKRKQAEKVLNQLQSFLPRKNRLKLEDKIGYGGNSLSNGQEMILMFARAVLANKSILVLDEPFKNMDNEMKAHFAKVLSSLALKKMILLFSKQDSLKHLRFESTVSLDQMNRRVIALKAAV